MGVIGVTDQAIISAAILAVLALVSINLLSNRRENEAIQNALLHISSSTSLSDKFFKQEYSRSELQTRTKSSQSALFWGINFTRTIPLLVDDFEQGLQNNLKLRFLMIKPRSQASQAASFRNRTQNVTEINETIERNIRIIAGLATRSSSGEIEVRVIDYLPPYTIIAFDPERPNGVMFIRLTTFRVPNERRPTIQLRRTDDEFWYKFFLEQFEMVWKEAEIIDLLALAKKNDK